MTRDTLPQPGAKPLEPPPEAFFARDVLEVAPDCLGLELSAYTHTGYASGRIVEVEAYRGPDDRAAHSYGGRRTARTAAMFGPPGTCYVFLIYGLHSHVNIVTGAEGAPQAVLIRAIEPLDGIELMQKRRWTGRQSPGSKAASGLCDGPGKLCQALGIDRRFNGHGLLQAHHQPGDEFLRLSPGRPPRRVAISRRIGIEYAGEWAKKLWRFYDADSAFVSSSRQRSPTQ